MLRNIDTMSMSSVETTLHRRCTTSMQPFINAAQCRFNVDMTLSQRCFNVASQRQLKLYLLPFPSFLFHPLLRYFRQFPATLMQPLPALIRPTNLPWFKQISKGRFH